MDKNKSHGRIDLILLILFWISFFPDFTGLALHEWLGAAAMALAFWHLIQHWPWVKTVTLRLFSRTSSQARLYYLVDAGVMLGFFMILLTGLMISTWLNIPLYDMAAWTHVHLMASVFTLLLVVLKLVLHWRWIANALRRYIFDPLSGHPAADISPSPVNPVDRRDFLKLTGVLGVAAVATLHGLFDDSQAVQAQSIATDQAGTGAQPPTDASSASAQQADSGSVSEPVETAAATQADPSPTAEPAVACIVRCHNGCSYPGRCHKYVDRNGNNLCDNGECL